MKLSQKRILSILAAAALTVCAVPQNTAPSLLRPALTAYAETEGDFSYTPNEDNASVTVTGWTGTDPAVVIPDTLGGLPVTGIAAWAFNAKTNITSVTIPSGVTEIGIDAFNGCTGLTEVQLPDGLTEISDGLFIQCTGLTSIVIPDGVTRIGTNAFAGCTELADITIPDSVTSFGEAIFRATAWLTAQQAVRADHLVIVNQFLIDGTAASGNVTVPAGVTSISAQAFTQNSALTGISIPSSVTDIGHSAFYCCTALKTVTLRNGLKSIDSRAFYSCSELTEITMPNTVTKVGDCVFFGCESLASVQLSSGLTAIPDGGRQGFFQGCVSLKEICIPNGMEHIGIMAFAQCTELKKVTIPRTVKEIGRYAFYGTSGLMICGESGSDAATYAQQNGYDFEALEVLFNGVSVTLRDDLGLNFYISGMTEHNKDDYKMVFDGKCEEDGQDVFFAEKNSQYCASANVSADNMDEVITAMLYKKDGEEWVKIDSAAYCVNEYLTNAKPEEHWSEERANRFNHLVETVKLYGKVSYAYFNTPDDMRVFDVPSHTVNELTREGMDANFTSDDATLSLVLNSRMAVRLYVPGLTVGVTADSGETAVEGKRGAPCFEVTGITPLKLGEQYEVEYSGKTYSFTPLSWCCRALNLDGGSPKNPVMANMLFEYWQAAQSYQAIM